MKSNDFEISYKIFWSVGPLELAMLIAIYVATQSRAYV